MKRDRITQAALDELRRREKEYGWAFDYLRELRRALPEDVCFGGPPAQPLAGAGQESQVGERARRQAMLAAYKKRTGASNRAIYEAAQHTCRKPDFYEWLKGKLPSDSSAAKSLERFLAGDAPPRPRKKRPAGK